MHEPVYFELLASHVYFSVCASSLHCMEIPFMDASTSLALKSFMKSADSMAFTAGLFEFMNCTRHRCLGRFAKMDN